jgi:hypothetical protein
MTCVYCPHPIKNSEVYWELKCGRHMAHGSHGTTVCRVCTRTEATAAAAAVDAVYDSGETPTLHQRLEDLKQGQQEPVGRAPASSSASIVPAHEQAARDRRIANNVARRSEPLRPYEPSLIEGWFGSLLGVAGRVEEASLPDEESGDPVALLNAGVPLATLVRKHGFDITELINDPPAVTIADFYRNGYTMGEMCDAFASRMNTTEGMRVLYFLGMTDEYISARPHQSQVAVMKERLGFNVESLIRDLDYRFVPGRWTLPQMVEVGLTMPVVMRMGMRTWDEWLELRATAETMDDLDQFGATPQLEAKLIQSPPSSSSSTTGTSASPPLSAPAPVYTPAPVAGPPASVPVPSPSPPGLSSPNAPMYGHIVAKNWPVPQPPPQSQSVSASSSSSSTAKGTPSYSWGSRLPAEVVSFSTATAAAQPTSSVATVSRPRVDTTPKLVDRVPLVLPPLSQHGSGQATQKPKYALK